MVSKGNISEINHVFFFFFVWGGGLRFLGKAKDRSKETQFALMFFIAAPAAAPCSAFGRVVLMVWALRGKLSKCELGLGKVVQTKRPPFKRKTKSSRL